MNLNLLAQSSLNFLKLIDWSQFSLEVARCAYFTSTKEKIQSFPRKRSKKEIDQFHFNQNHFLEILEHAPFQEFYSNLSYLSSDIKTTDILKRVEKSAHLSFSELNSIVIFLESFSIIHKSSLKITENSEILKELFTQLQSKFTRPIRRFVLPTGEVDYLSHPELRNLFTQITSLDEKARDSIKSLKNKYKDQLQVSTHDILNDHYVLLFKASHFEHKMGFIHAKSESAQTLYVEPHELKKISQQRKDLFLQIDKILLNLSRKYSEVLHECYVDLKKVIQHIYLIDFFYSLTLFNKAHGLIAPTITDLPQIKFENFFHPLVKDPVKNNIQLTKTSQGIIISGPNTGGKSVALKSICLNIILAQTGYFVAADEAYVFEFDEIYFLSQDHQSLSDGLSSFSSEAHHYLALLDQIGPNSVVFIDEIFNSTSSEEASALALGLFDYLKSQINPFIFVSTHHQMLKTLTHQSQEFLSYNVGFDPDSLRPSYKLYQTGPGSSEALNIFKKIGANYPFTSKIIDKGEKVLGRKYIEYEKLLSEVSKKNAELSKELIKQKETSDQLENQFKAQIGLSKLKAKEMVEAMKNKLKDLEQEANDVLHQVKNKEIQSSKDLDRKFLKIEEKIPVEKEQSREKPINIEPAVGDKYIYIPMRRVATVLKVDKTKQKVTLDLSGKFKIEAQFSDLAFGPNIQKKRTDDFNYTLTKHSQESVSLDARGMRLEDFKNEVEKSLTSLYSGAIPYLEIIHGHGNGILKNWLRSYILAKSDLEVEIPKKSLDGATILKLR